MNIKAKCITPRDSHHFFGYYDRCPWDKSNRFLLTMESDFSERRPKPSDVARIGVIDFRDDCSFHLIAETRAWNFAQGALLHWIDNQSEPTFIHNDRRDGRFVAIIRNVDGKELNVLPSPVADISDDGLRALSLNFARLARTIPHYGYRGVPDRSINHLCPADDGIWLMPVSTGKAELVVSLEQLSRINLRENMLRAEHYVNHLLFNPSGTRFAFVHRWGAPRKSAWVQYLCQLNPRQYGMRAVRKTTLPLYNWVTGMELGTYESRLYTANTDGTGLRCLADDSMVSHYFWRDDHHLLCWARRKPQGDRYWLFDDRNGKAQIIGDGVFDRDGHCSFSSDLKWMLTDTYPDDDLMQTLILYNIENGKRIDVGRFCSQRLIRSSVMACDLHPRFDRQGAQVCFDSTHEGVRQLYVADVSDINQNHKQI